MISLIAYDEKYTSESQVKGWLELLRVGTGGQLRQRRLGDNNHLVDSGHASASASASASVEQISGWGSK